MHIKAQEFITEIEQSLATARQLRPVLNGPLVKVKLTADQEATIDAQIHTLEGVLKIARETFEVE